MSFRIDNAELANIARNAGALPPLPVLDQPLPPSLMALGQRLGQGLESEALSVPPGCHPRLSRELLEQLLKSLLPNVMLVEALPTLSTLANLRLLAAVRLGFPLPDRLALVTTLMQTLDLSQLSVIEQMPWGSLSRLAFLLNLGAMLRLRLNIDPLHADASLRIAEQLPLRMPAFGLTLPPYSQPQMVVRLGYAMQLRLLLKVAEMLGVNLLGPGGVPQLSLAIRSLLGVRLPVLRVVPSLLPRLNLVVAINQLWPLHTLSATMPRLVAHLNALVNLRVPQLPGCIGPPAPPNPAAMSQQLPTPAVLQSILAADFTELSKVNWNIPPQLPIADALPGLNALALLKDLGPIIKPA